MSHCIDADALIEKLGIAKECNDCKHNKEPYCGWKPDVVDICEAINDAPTIEPERAEGKWIPFDVEYECSHCGIILNFYEGSPKANNANFCPNCGADMRGKQDG